MMGVEITHITSHGLWIHSEDKDLFMSYEDFPWFKDKMVESIIKVEELSLGHFYWPEIDVDLTIESIEYPERFPLKSK